MGTTKRSMAAAQSRSLWPALLLGAIGLGVWPTAAVAQATPPPTLPAALRDHVKSERFDVVTSVRGLPLGVRDGLQTLFGSATLDIGESNTEIQGAAVASTPKRPLRRLVAAGCSVDHCLVYYERGGAERSWRVVLFYWTPGETRFEWGGLARSGLATIDGVRSAVLAGTVKGPVSTW